MDERDQEIMRNATIGAYSVFWVLFVLACVLPAFVLGFDAKIPVLVLSIAVFVAAAVFWGTQSLITVILYRRGRGAAEGENHAAA